MKKGGLAKMMRSMKGMMPPGSQVACEKKVRKNVALDCFFAKVSKLSGFLYDNPDAIPRWGSGFVLLTNEGCYGNEFVLEPVAAQKRPFYQVVVTDSRNARDGRFIER